MPRWSAECARKPAAAVGNADDAAAAVEQVRLAQDIGGDILAGATSEFVQHRTSSTEDSELRGRPAPEQRRPSRSNISLTSTRDVRLPAESCAPGETIALEACIKNGPSCLFRAP